MSAPFQLRLTRLQARATRGEKQIDAEYLRQLDATEDFWGLADLLNGERFDHELENNQSLSGFQDACRRLLATVVHQKNRNFLELESVSEQTMYQLKRKYVSILNTRHTASHVPTSATG